MFLTLSLTSAEMLFVDGASVVPAVVEAATVTRPASKRDLAVQLDIFRQEHTCFAVASVGEIEFPWAPAALARRKRAPLELHVAATPPSLALGPKSRVWSPLRHFAWLAVTVINPLSLRCVEGGSRLRSIFCGIAQLALSPSGIARFCFPKISCRARLVRFIVVSVSETMSPSSRPTLPREGQVAASSAAPASLVFRLAIAAFKTVQPQRLGV